MEQTHIINKVVIEVNTQDKTKAYSVKENISSFLMDRIFPELENYINGLQNTTVQIDHLSLNVNLNTLHLNNTLKEAVLEAFKKELEELIPLAEQQYLSDKEKTYYSQPKRYDNNETKVSKADILSSNEALANTLIYFFKEGKNPWWYTKSILPLFDIKVVEEIMSSTNFIEKLLSILKNNSVKERIINQLGDKEIIGICQMIANQKASEINLKNSVLNEISKLSAKQRLYFWKLILTYLYSIKKQDIKGNVSNNDLKQLTSLSKVLNEETLIKTVFKKTAFYTKRTLLLENNTSTLVEEKKVVKEKETVDQKHIEDAIYATNVGLILTHPFLKTFFKRCDLLDDNNQLIDSKLAVHLLHYIATGKTNQVESDLIFEKIICNIPINQSISRHIVLSKKHKREAEKITQAIKNNWSSMKTASVELLQNEFFQRSGKIEFGESINLTVERKTQDILLDKLPWGIGIVKLPWLNKMIYTNW